MWDGENIKKYVPESGFSGTYYSWYVPKMAFWGTCLVFISIKISSIFGFLLIVQAALAQLGIEDMLRQIVSYTLSYGQSISIWLANEVNFNIFGICPVFGCTIIAKVCIKTSLANFGKACRNFIRINQIIELLLLLIPN